MKQLSRRFITCCVAMTPRCPIQGNIRFHNIRSKRWAAVMMTNIWMLLLLLLVIFFSCHTLISNGSVSTVIKIDITWHRLVDRRRIARVTGRIHRQTILLRNKNKLIHRNLSFIGFGDQREEVKKISSTYSYHNVGQRTVDAIVAAHLWIRRRIWTRTTETEHVRIVHWRAAAITKKF